MSQAEELLDSLDETIPTHQHDVIDSNSYFVIDPITRAVENTSGSKNLLMQYDHASERYTFELPRYVEGHDMSLCTAVKVHYNNIESGTLIENADVNDLDDLHVDPTDANKVICSWLIKRQATQLVGSLNFLVQYLCATSDGTITYEWHSDIYKNIEIREGRNNGPAAVSDYTDILEQWRAKLFGVEDSITASILALLEDFSADVLKKDNTEEYTPTENYHPSTKKYVDDNISKLSEEIANAGSGMTATVKNAFLECFANVAWATAEGQACYDKLKTALNESVGEIKLSSITATCSETVQIGTAASDLDIVVTAIYSDGSSVQVTGWTTIGTVVEGTNTFVVSYGGKSATVTVTGVDLYYVLNKATNKSELMSSKTYSDGGETSAGFPNVYCAWHLWGSKVVEQDTSVKIKYIPSVSNYNGVYAYCMNPETFTGSTTGNKYYAVRLASPALVDTSYEWEYTIKAGYAFGISLGSDSPVPTVEVVS